MAIVTQDQSAVAKLLWKMIEASMEFQHLQGAALYTLLSEGGNQIVSAAKRDDPEEAQLAAVSAFNSVMGMLKRTDSIWGL